MCAKWTLLEIQTPLILLLRWKCHLFRFVCKINTNVVQTVMLIRFDWKRKWAVAHASHYRQSLAKWKKKYIYIWIDTSQKWQWQQHDMISQWRYREKNGIAFFVVVVWTFWAFLYYMSSADVRVWRGVKSIHVYIYIYAEQEHEDTELG